MPAAAGPARIEATRRIHAPASAIWELVSTPQGHVRIDGSGMLVAAPSGPAPSAVGDVFVIDMDRRPLGDIPDMAEYQVHNVVTAFEPDRVFEWTVGGADRPPVGYVYGWRIDPIDGTVCDVTNYCDWSRLDPEIRSRSEGRWPVVPLRMLERSVARLEELVAG
jgi:hypothetical protein